MTTVGTFCLPHKYFSGDANLCMLQSNVFDVTVRIDLKYEEVMSALQQTIDHFL